MFSLRKKIKRIIFYLLPVFLFIVDRYLKIFYLAKEKVFYNKKIGLSIYLPAGIFYLLFCLIFAGLILGLIASYKRKKIFYIFSFYLIIAGALSNLIDRLFFGAVLDYFKLYSSIFNLADLAILAGVLLIFFSKLTEWRKGKS